MGLGPKRYIHQMVGLILEKNQYAPQLRPDLETLKNPIEGT